ncbi:MAG TPA: hypothetical protein VIS07_23100 [Candidatus Binatia bacterium]
MRPYSGIVARRLRRCLRAAIVGLPLALVEPVAAQEMAPPGSENGRLVSRTESGYTIDAYETNLVQVLTEIGSLAGFTVEAPDNFNSPLTLSAENLPLDQLLQRVLRNENYIIVYRGGVQKTAITGEGIDKIFLLSQASSGPMPRAAAATGASPLAGPGAQPARRAVPGTKAQPAAQGEQAPGEGGDLLSDLAARAQRARERAEARQAATGAGGAMPPAPPGPAPAPPDTAHVVEAPEDFTPPPIEGDSGEDHVAGDMIDPAHDEANDEY